LKTKQAKTLKSEDPDKLLIVNGLYWVRADSGDVKENTTDNLGIRKNQYAQNWLFFV
jgi:hypothetical protein